MIIPASRRARDGSACSRTSGNHGSDIEDQALAKIMFEFWTARLRRELNLPASDSFAVTEINKRLDELRPDVGHIA